MDNTKPENVLPIIEIVRDALNNKLLTKDEVIDWADKIITKDSEPDIFFIDLALSSSKSVDEIIVFLERVLDAKQIFKNDRVSLGLLYKKFINGQFKIEEAVRILYILTFNSTLTEREKSYLFGLDKDYRLAVDNIAGTITQVKITLQYFLNFYENYSLDNFEKWDKLDKIVEEKMVVDYRSDSKQTSKGKTIDKEIEKLTKIFREAGANNPESWASSQIKENINQLGRFSFLKAISSGILKENEYSWIDNLIEFNYTKPDDPSAQMVDSLKEMLAKNVSRAAIIDLIRTTQFQTLFHVCSTIDGCYEPETPVCSWGLFEIDENGDPIKNIGGLHESLLEFDPSGNEMRPRKKEAT